VTTTLNGTNVPPPTAITGEPPTSTASTTVSVSLVDTDKDGLTDDREKALGLMLDNPDTDGDGLSDGDEVLVYNTNPLNPDTDGDGFTDGSEVEKGYDPRGPGKCVNSDCKP